MMTTPFDSDALDATAQFNISNTGPTKSNQVFSPYGVIIYKPHEGGNGGKFYMAISAKQLGKHMHVHGVSILFKDMEKQSEVSDHLKQLYKN